MTRSKLVGAALVLSVMPVSAQVSEPAAAAARDPNFSIYSSGGADFGASRAMTQAPPEDTLGPRTSVWPHRTHHAMKHYRSLLQSSFPNSPDDQP